MNNITDVVDLLNEFNHVLGKKRREIGCVSCAASMLLANSLRQMGREHGLERAKVIAGEIESIIKGESGGFPIMDLGVWGKS